MAEYIERDKLVAAILQLKSELNTGLARRNLKQSDIMKVIAEFPAADVALVVHGEWVSLTECANAGVYCSVCNKKVWKEDYAWCNRKNKLRSNYCPNCGAKMDLED